MRVGLLSRSRSGVRHSATLATALVVQACASDTTEAVDPRVAAADSIVASWVADERVPGAVLLIAPAQEPPFVRAYGWAELYDYGSGQYPPAGSTDPSAQVAGGIVRSERPRPMTVDTPFDLASVTKVMATTMAVMILVDRGRVDVDAPVATYLSDFVGGAKETITLRHLLTHRSGVEQWKPTYYHAADADESYAYVRDLPLAWPVGDGRHYSDLGFMLLGRIVESVSGERLDDFLRTELYGPLGLIHTGFRPGGSPGGDPAPAATSHGNPFERRMVYDPAFGYAISDDPRSWDGWRRRTLVGEVNDGNAWHAFRGVAGHAGLFSTAGELERLLRMLLDGGTVDGRRIVGAETVARFLEAGLDAQALGWLVPDYAPPSAFAHTGFTGTFVYGDRASGTAVVLLTNRQNVGVDDATQYPDVGPLQRAVVGALTR